MINIIFSISFYIAIGFIFYILLKRRAFFSLSVLGLYFLYLFFIFILVTFDESFFWGLFATLMSLLSWSWLFLLFFVPALFFDFWKAKRVAIQNSQPKSNQRQKTYLMIIIFLILISIGGVFYFFSKKEENISIKNKKNEESSQFSGKKITKNFGDTGIIVISPQPNQTIPSPLKITGYIDNFGDGWEGDFGSVELFDIDGKKITSKLLSVDATDGQGEYKERPYSFESTLVFNTLQTEGILIFYENTARGDVIEKFRLPVKFNKNMASGDDLSILSIDNWKTYRNNKYGFEIKYPLKLNNTGEEALASVLGNVDNPIKGIYVGSLVFIVLDSSKLKEEAKDYFDRYYNYNNSPSGVEESEEIDGMTCSSEIIKNYLFTRYVKCHGGGGVGVYAFIEGDNVDIFIDGYSGGFKESRDFVNLSEEEVKEILSTFKFVR